MRLQMRSFKNGFTLVETIVALTIGLMLITIVLGIFARAFGRGKHMEDRIHGIHVVAYLAGAIERDAQMATRAGVDDEDLVLTLPTTYDPLHPARTGGGEIRYTLTDHGAIRRTVSGIDGARATVERLGTGRYQDLRFSTSNAGDALTVCVTVLPARGEPPATRSFTLRVGLVSPDDDWPQNGPPPPAQVPAD